MVALWSTITIAVVVALMGFYVYALIRMIGGGRHR
jgi:hypothetical protein